MTDKDANDDSSSADDGGDAQFADLDANIEVAPPKKQRAAGWLAALALLVAAIALSGVGWLYLTRPAAPEPFVQDFTRVDAVAANVTDLRQGIEEVSGRLQQLANRDSAARGEFDAIERQFEQRFAVFESLPGRMGNIEDTVASIQGISAGVRDTWLLAEAEYYMQIANAQLQLAGNPHLARLALMQADERITQLANPSLTNVRRTLAGEMRQLEVMVRPDIEGITLSLASLADAVDALPIKQQLAEPGAAPDELQEDLSGVDRMMASLKSTMSDVVSVRRVDEDVRPFIAPESAWFLRANLALQLQAARLALLRAETAIFQRSLDDADAWLSAYYLADSPQVASARQTIADIRGKLFDIEAPDISESLRLLRQFNALAAAEAPATPVVDEPAPSGEEDLGTPAGEEQGL